MYNFKGKKYKRYNLFRFAQRFAKNINKYKKIMHSCEYYVRKQQVAKEHKLAQNARRSTHL